MRADRLVGVAKAGRVVAMMVCRLVCMYIGCLPSAVLSRCGME